MRKFLISCCLVAFSLSVLGCEPPKTPKASEPGPKKPAAQTTAAK